MMMKKILLIIKILKKKMTSLKIKLQLIDEKNERKEKKFIMMEK